MVSLESFINVMKFKGRRAKMSKVVLLPEVKYAKCI